MDFARTRPILLLLTISTQEEIAMNIPGFTAENSAYKTARRFRSETPRSIANGTKHNQVYMQKPNSENTPGGGCIGRISGTTITGHYDSMGRCCEDPAPNKFPSCVDCDYPNHCYDKATISHWFPFGTTVGGVFTT